MHVVHLPGPYEQSLISLCFAWLNQTIITTYNACNDYTDKAWDGPILHR